MKKYFILFILLFLARENFIFASTQKTVSQQNFVREHKESIEAGGISEINISIHSGNISIAGSSGSEITVTLRKTISGQSKDVADTLFDMINFGYSNDSGLLTFRTKINGTIDTIKRVNELIKKSSFLTDVEILVPQGLTVSASSLKGDIRAYNLKNGVTASTMSGNINIEEVKNDINVYAIKGNLYSTKTTGNFVASLYEGKISIKNVLGKINADNNKGDIIITDATGNINSKSVSGDIFLSNINGNIVSDSIKGKIRINSSLGSLDAKSEKGSIETRNIVLGEADKLSLVSMDGDLSAGLSDSISGNINATTKSGIIKNDFDIKTSSGTLIGLKPRSNSLVGFLNMEKNGKNEVLLTTINGNIILKKQKTK